MKIQFITGNENKFKEAQKIIPELEQLDIDLPEIQEVDAHEVIKAKLIEAQKHHGGVFVVEDTSLYLDCLNGLPGPLIKWFEKTIGNEGLCDIAKKYNDYGAQAKTIVGYGDESGNIKFFEGILEGRIVAPVGDNDFGWGPIFRLDETGKTFAQMSAEEKNAISMRRVAFDALRQYLK
ncbi:MAG: non-canonical purine NTP pyrophosphatase [Patescibacteria group bacterium]|nr:non-canonical purine NTP pyrophosphatase [Patescibacteria group bacterium]